MHSICKVLRNHNTFIMQKYLAAAGIIFLFSCSKKTETVENPKIEKETVYVEKPQVEKPENPKPENETKPSETLQSDVIKTTPIGAGLVGEHRMIWKYMPENSAILHVTKMTNGNLDATGGTEAYGSSFSLEGEIKKISDTEYEFNGKIKTYQYGRNGYFCEKIQKARFKQMYDSEYFRYEFIDCKGHEDYIDIF